MVIYSPLTVIKCGFSSVVMNCVFVSDKSVASCVCTKATCAVNCWEFELLGDDAADVDVGIIVETVIGASSVESD